MPAVDPITPTTWTRLSPWLDELLALAPAERGPRLAQIRQQDAHLATQLAQLMAQLEGLDDAGFMAAPAQPAPLPAGPSAAAGQMAGPYRLERLLGEGGMGAVWLASRSDGRFQGQAAIKFLHTARHSPAQAQRFAREAQLLARLSHPHITRLLDAGITDTDQQPYLVLEYVQGQPIDQWCDAQDLNLHARLRLLLDVLDAVAHAHDRLVLHRDLKPSNILVNTQGEVRLLDFGIARMLDDSQPAQADLTRLGGLPYTPRWASPEQVAGAELTMASDVFALGLLAHTLLTGLHPLGDATTGADPRQLQALLDAPLPLASAQLQRQGPAGGTPRTAPNPAQKARHAARVRALRGDLDTLLAKALKRAPAERYRSAGDMADDLRRHLRQEPILARPDSALYRARRFVRRHWVAVGASAAVLAALATGGGVALAQAREAQAQRAQAEGLLEYMLGDLRARLEPLGQLALLDGVGQRAQAYYQAQALHSLDDAGLARRSEALLVLGNIAQLRENTQDMVRLAADAQASSRLLLQRQPGAPAALTLAARAHSLAAWAAELQGRLADSLALYEQAIAWSEQALARAPDDLAVRLNLAEIQGELAAYHVELGGTSVATGLALFEREYATQVALAPQRPQLWREVSINRSWVADALYTLGQYEASLAALRQQQQAHAQLPDLAQQPAAQWDGVLAGNRESGVLLALNRLEEARAVSERTVAQGDALVASDPANVYWATNHAVHRHWYATVLNELGRRDEAVRQLRLAHTRMQRLPVPPGGESASVQGDWLRVLSGLARLQPQDDALFDDLRERLLAEAQRHANTPRSEAMAREVGRAHLALGELWAARQRPAAARQAWGAGLQAMATDSLRDQPMPLRVDLLLALGRRAEARAEVRALRAQGWRAPLPEL